MTKHKCRVFKEYYQGFNSGRKVWLVHCYNKECYYYKAYAYYLQWEVAVLKAIYHKVSGE